jgi:hypothetical protein
MRGVVCLVLMAACGSGPAIQPDAAVEPDAGIANGGPYWDCWFWQDTSATVDMCSPQCSNRTLLGRFVFGEKNTCEYAPGQMCPREFMTGPAHESDTGCCVPTTNPERVQFVSCL